MKRNKARLNDVAAWDNLARAFRLAARGKRGRRDVEAFRANLEANLAQMQTAILDGSVKVGSMRSFRICDPKPRLIHAPCFRERILHHALMAHVGPVLDRALIDDSYACREGKGSLAAVERAQHHCLHYPWYAQIDIEGYFANIDHGLLYRMLERKFKNCSLLALIWNIIASGASGCDRGLPIGALTSQYFANFYLSGADRHLVEECRVPGFVRYMDDLLWWGRSREEVRVALTSVTQLLENGLGLTVKHPPRVGRSRHGLSFCGFRIFGERLLLSRRRQRRYAEHRARWEARFAAGEINSLTLQRGYTSALAVTAHAEAAVWRRRQLCRRPLAPIVVDA